MPKYNETLAAGRPYGALQVIDNFSLFLYLFLPIDPGLRINSGSRGGSEEKQR